jgi:DNA repair protein RadC
MRSSKASLRHLNVRSNCGSIVTPAPRFSSGLVLEVRGAYGAVSDDDVIAAALRIVSRRVVTTDVLSSPRATREYLALRFAGLEHEVFGCIFVNSRNRVIAFEELFRGTIDGASVHPREVAKRALHHNCAAVILAHNHPSGVAEPSQADELITVRLKEALALLDVRVLDHLVVGGETVTSFAERGLL